MMISSMKMQSDERKKYDEITHLPPQSHVPILFTLEQNSPIHHRVFLA